MIIDHDNCHPALGLGRFEADPQTEMQHHQHHKPDGDLDDADVEDDENGDADVDDDADVESDDKQTGRQLWLCLYLNTVIISVPMPILDGINL